MSLLMRLNYRKGAYEMKYQDFKSKVAKVLGLSVAALNGNFVSWAWETGKTPEWTALQAEAQIKQA